MSHKNYNLILLIPLGSLFAVFIFLALWVEPIEGDLTRLGGFTENDFGWNEPQQQFSSMLFTLEGRGNTTGIMTLWFWAILFPTPPQEPNGRTILSRETGLSLITYKVDDIDIESFVASPAYKDHPPRIVIYETVERSFRGPGNAWNKGNCKPAAFPSPRGNRFR